MPIKLPQYLGMVLDAKTLSIPSLFVVEGIYFDNRVAGTYRRVKAHRSVNGVGSHGPNKCIIPVSLSKCVDP
jgi:hypothetical protein